METEDNRSAARLRKDISVGCVSVKGSKESWQKWSSDHQAYQKSNPFSHATGGKVEVPHRGKHEYGRPPQGSMTEQRGRDAHTHISREVQELCDVIRAIGELREEDEVGHNSGGKVITVQFGKLFDHYVTVSNKLVGILLRARKQRLVDFDGEMLWQGKDDHVVISLLP